MAVSPEAFLHLGRIAEALGECVDGLAGYGTPEVLVPSGQ